MVTSLQGWEVLGGEDGGAPEPNNEVDLRMLLVINFGCTNGHEEGMGGVQWTKWKPRPGSLSVLDLSLFSFFFLLFYLQYTLCVFIPPYHLGLPSLSFPFMPIRSQEKDPLGPTFIRDDNYMRLQIPTETLG